MARDEYTQKLELALGRMMYATRLVMDIVNAEGIGSDAETSEQAVNELLTARKNAEAVMEGTL